MADCIEPEKLDELVRAGSALTLLDVRRTVDFANATTIIPGAVWRDPEKMDDWLPSLARSRSIVVYCVKGAHVGSTVAQRLAGAGFDAKFVAGGIKGWEERGLAAIPKPAPLKFVTRAHARVDRIACPWLIRRFIDPSAEILFVPSGEVAATAARDGAIPFDVEGAELGHHGEHCSFDAFLDKFGLDDPALRALAAIVRGADTSRLDLTPESAGLYALATGFQALSPARYADDHRLLEVEGPVYDALYESCRLQRAVS